MFCRRAGQPALPTATIARIGLTPKEMLDRLEKLRRALAAAEEAAAAALNLAHELQLEIDRLERRAARISFAPPPHPLAAGALSLVDNHQAGGGAA